MSDLQAVLAKLATMKTPKVGRPFKRGAKILTIAAKAVPSTKGESVLGEGGKVALATHDDKTPLTGRKVDHHEGGLKSRAEWIRYQSGGLTPADLLRAAD